MRNKSSLTESLTQEISESQKSNPRQTKEAPSKEKLRGIGGWLLFFCLCLTVLSPVLTVYSLSLWNFSLELTLERWVAEIAKDAVAIYGIITGIMLWMKKRTALVQTRIFLLVSMGLILVESVYDIVLGTDQWLTIFGSVANIVYWGLWLLYFANSRRVVNTFSGEETTFSSEKKE